MNEPTREDRVQELDQESLNDFIAEQVKKGFTSGSGNDGEGHC